MSRRIVPIDTISPIAAGSAFWIELAIGPTYHALELRLTNLAKDEVTDLFLYLDGKPVCEFADLAELDSLNTYYNRIWPTNHSTWFFERPEFQEQFRQLTSLGTNGLKTVVIRGKIDAGAVNPALEVYADQENVARAPGLITKIRKFPKDFSVSGAQVVQNIPHQAGIAAIHLMKSDVSAVKLETLDLKNERRTEVDATKTVLQARQDQFRTPSANFTTVDFVASGLPRDVLVGTLLKEFTIKPTVDTSGSMPIIMEYLDSVVGV